jgi:hypothetical protein
MSNDLVGWWPLHEDSGDANDLSGESNDGTVSGAVQGVAGRSGLTGYSFDGTDDYVDIPDNIGVFSGSEDFTIALWIRPKDLTTDYVRHIHFQGEGKVEIYNSATNGEVTYAVEQDGAGSSRATTASVSTNEWTHLVGTFSSGSTMELYKDASLVDFLSHSITSTTQNNTSSRIGSFDGTSYWFDGSIADARVYNRVLSQMEVQALYDQGTDDYTEPSLSDGTDPNAITRLKMDDDSDTTTAIDSWGSNDGTIDGATYETADTIDGNALSFDGVDNSVNLGDPANLNFGTGNFTISCWVKAPGTGTYEDYVTKKHPRDYNGYVMRMRSGKLRAELRDSNDNIIRLQPYIDIDHDEWVHTTLTRDGADAYLYLNGGIVDSGNDQNLGSIDTSVDFKLAETDSTEFEDEGNRFEGELDDLRIYDRALSDVEVFELYQWGTRGRDLRKELVKT